METMGDRIRYLRQAKGLTIEELASLCGVTKGAVSQWERGQTKNIKNRPWLKLLSVLGTTGEFLLFGPDQPKNAPTSGGNLHKHG